MSNKAAILLCVVLSARCTSPLELDGSACPCTEGWVCCAVDNTCLREASACPYYCPNGRIDPGEACDGANLGTTTCESLGFVGGDLGCTADCQYDPGGCRNTGVVRPLDQPSSYDLRLDGSTALEYLADWDTVELGDVNGDGVLDLAVGATGASYSAPEAGSVYIILGPGGFTPGERTLAAAGSYQLRLDGAIELDMTPAQLVIADVNGDGDGDLIVLSWSDTRNAWIIFSTLIHDLAGAAGNNYTLADPGSYNLRIESPAADGWMAQVLAGDVNGDGLGDLVLSVPQTNATGPVSSSAFVLLSTLIDDVGASTGNVLDLTAANSFNVRFDEATQGDSLTVGAIGDVNEDGMSDLVLGAPEANALSGSAYVVFSTLIAGLGQSTGNVRVLDSPTSFNARIDGATALDYLTAYGALLAVGDVNGDGHPDLVVGSLLAFSEAGGVWLLFSSLFAPLGETTGNILPLASDPSFNVRYDGEPMEGTPAVIRIGDVDGDGLSDLVIGAEDAAYNGERSGSIWVILSSLLQEVGAATGRLEGLNDPGVFTARFDGSQGQALTGPNGAAVVGDVNGDGLSDLLFGSSETTYNGEWSGSVWVVASTLMAPLRQMTGTVLSLSDHASYTLRYDGARFDGLPFFGNIHTGDLTGDGLADLVLSSPSADNNGVDSGSVWVIGGSHR